MVFSSLIETREQFDTAMQHFDKGFEALLSTMDDPNPTVIKYSLQGWSRIFNRIQFRTAFVQKVPSSLFRVTAKPTSTSF